MECNTDFDWIQALVKNNYIPKISGQEINQDCTFRWFSLVMGLSANWLITHLSPCMPVQCIKMTIADAQICGGSAWFSCFSHVTEAKYCFLRKCCSVWLDQICYSIFHLGTLDRKSFFRVIVWYCQAASKSFCVGFFVFSDSILCGVNNTSATS